MDSDHIQAFIRRWAKSGGAERANYQLFPSELCDVLEVPRPDPTVEDDSQNAYVFERYVRFDNLDVGPLVLSRGTATPRFVAASSAGCGPSSKTLMA